MDSAREIRQQEAAVNGMRRPWTMIAAEIVAWCYTALVALVFFVQVFDSAILLGLEGILLGAFLAWRILLPLLIHCGKRMFATAGISIEWILWAGFCRGAESMGWFFAMSGFSLVPSVLLWLPASGRWVKNRKECRAKVLMWLVRIVMALLIPPMFLCAVYAVVMKRVAAGRDSGALAITAALFGLAFLALFWVDHRLARRKV